MTVEEVRALKQELLDVRNRLISIAGLVHGQAAGASTALLAAGDDIIAARDALFQHEMDLLGIGRQKA